MKVIELIGRPGSRHLSSPRTFSDLHNNENLVKNNGDLQEIFEQEGQRFNDTCGSGRKSDLIKITTKPAWMHKGNQVNFGKSTPRIATSPVTETSIHHPLRLRIDALHSDRFKETLDE